MIQSIQPTTHIHIKMRAAAIITTFLSIRFVLAERNIIPSPAVCATFPNEEFAIDYQRCQNTCAFYGRTWDCHLNYYKPNGDCYCKNGFARLTEDGPCVSVTDNAACKAKLPTTAASCSADEVFIDSVYEGNEAKCLTYGSRFIGLSFLHWGPQCICRQQNYRRLSSGNCVHVSDPECVAEYQPSPKRCSAIGQIYATNAPCQPTCNSETYCPPASGACICPSGQFADKFSEVYTVYDNDGIYVNHEVPMIRCLVNCLI